MSKIVRKQQDKKLVGIWIFTELFSEHSKSQDWINLRPVIYKLRPIILADIWDFLCTGLVTMSTANLGMEYLCYKSGLPVIIIFLFSSSPYDLNDGGGFLS